MDVIELGVELSFNVMYLFIAVKKFVVNFCMFLAIHLVLLSGKLFNFGNLMGCVKHAESSIS